VAEEAEAEAETSPVLSRVRDKDNLRDKVKKEEEPEK
jgi:hypothetical protein